MGFPDWQWGLHKYSPVFTELNYPKMPSVLVSYSPKRNVEENILGKSENLFLKISKRNSSLNASN